MKPEPHKLVAEGLPSPVHTSLNPSIMPMNTNDQKEVLIISVDNSGKLQQLIGGFKLLIKT
jgi:hypothetical protein